MAALALPQLAAAQAPAYQITFKNLTSDAVATEQTGQRLSPPVFITHSADYKAYTVGQAAPETIWRIAESGDRSVLLNEVNALVGTSVLSVVAPLSAPLPQQDSVAVTVNADAAHRYLSFASMLGWTNDGFVGVSGLDLSTITGTVTINLYGYDAGSEKNSETNGFLGALSFGNARDPEGGVITTHLGIRGDADAPAAWNWLPGPGPPSHRGGSSRSAHRLQRSRFTMSCPSGVRRSNASERLLRDWTCHHTEVPSSNGRHLRSGSPVPGGSILMTSAPKSARVLAAKGPAMS